MDQAAGTQRRRDATQDLRGSYHCHSWNSPSRRRAPIASHHGVYPNPPLPRAALQEALSYSGHFPQRRPIEARRRGPLPAQPQKLPGSQAHLRDRGRPATARLPGTPRGYIRASWPSDTASQTSSITPDTQQQGREGTPGAL